MTNVFFQKYRLWLLLAVSALTRLLIAAFTELGNDEVYYINYALYPDLSHFDHPPMTGWIIQLFSLNLLFESEGFIRLGAVVLGTLNTWLIYLIGRQLRDELTGWYGALLYTASFYCSIIAGTFMMPDAPQTFFWLLTLLMVLKAVKAGPESSGSGNYLLLAGLAGGLALLSKYTSVFLFTGAGLYFLIFDRKWLGKWQVYAAGTLSLLLFTPVIIWNIRYDFVSFTFHSDRVEVVKTILRPDLFAAELGGQVFYNNPFVFTLVMAGLIAFLRGRFAENKHELRLLISTALPVILLFLGFSLFRRTLPHWTGPAYMTLIPLAALFIRVNTEKGMAGRWTTPMIRNGLFFLVIVVSAALIQINLGWFLNKGIDRTTGKRLGIKDITLDLYGWEQLHQQFTGIYRQDTASGRMPKDAVIISQRWFPAANLDYYVARPMGLKLLTLAESERTHKYAWITQFRGGFIPGMDAYYFSSSYDFSDPKGHYSDLFKEIGQPDTIPVYRNDKLVMYHYVWRLKGLKSMPPDRLTGKDLFLKP
ncbi:MAG: glycosyltransferase family 39 protein [Bacteroidales bacterium]|nr:glycosyltransferase family 39 protein [Bacteroidales bacterium]